MRSPFPVLLLSLLGSCVMPCNHRGGVHEGGGRSAAAAYAPVSKPAEATAALQASAPTVGHPCAFCAALQAPAPVPPAGHDDGPGGADCALCAGQAASSPLPVPNPDVPGGTGPPGGWGTPPAGSTPAGVASAGPR